jgi:hypothetical protein
MNKNINNNNLVILTAVAVSVLFVITFYKKENKSKKEKIPYFLIVDHDVGFFSCFNVKLQRIVEFINKYKTFPKVIDGSRQFGLYKRSQDKALKKDITFDFFVPYETKKDIQSQINPKMFIHFNENFQYKNYKNCLNFKILDPLIQLYFTPSQKVLDTRDFLQKKYNIDPLNCIGVYFRGTDKKTETRIASFETFYNKIIEIREKNFGKNTSLDKNTEIQKNKIFLQTDTAQFVDYMIKEKQMNKDDFILIEENATSYSSTGIHNEKIGEDNYNEIFFLFATFLLLAKSKYFICSSGNCSLSMMFYRGHGENVYQFLNDKWLA